MSLTKEELLIAGRLLDIASKEFSNHGSNDLEESILSGVSQKERQDIAKRIEIWNGSPELYESGDDVSKFPDWMLMEYLASKLKESNE